MAEHLSVTRPRLNRRWLIGGAFGAAAMTASIVMTTVITSDPPDVERPVLGEITGVDWGRAQIVLPTGSGMDCPAGRQDMQPSAESGGRLAWSPGEPGDDNIIVDLTMVAFGDLTGDGQSEAVLHVRCTTMNPAQALEVNMGGQLLVVGLQNRTLVGLAYVGKPHARYPSFRVEKESLIAQVSYERIDELATAYSIYAPAHARSYRWNGSSFDQISGRDSALVLAPSKAEWTGSLVQLPAILRNGSTACAANALRFKESAAQAPQASYYVTGNAQPIDLDGDGNEELIAQITCTANGKSADSIYVLRQGDDGFVTLDVPVANNGQYEIQDGWKITGRDLTVTVKNRATGENRSYSMHWRDNAFDGALGDFRP